MQALPNLGWQGFHIPGVRLPRVLAASVVPIGVILRLHRSMRASAARAISACKPSGVHVNRSLLITSHAVPLSVLAAWPELDKHQDIPHSEFESNRSFVYWSLDQTI